MNNDLISRKALLDQIAAKYRASSPSGEEQLGYLECSRMVREFPTADDESVARCYTCKHYEVDCGFCNYHGHGMHWDDFCSRGEAWSNNVGVL